MTRLQFSQPGAAGNGVCRLIGVVLAPLALAAQLLLAPQAACSAAASPAAAGTARLAIRVLGNRLVDADGKPLQLRGSNVSGLENTAIQGWAKKPDGGYDNWGDAKLGPEPDWSKLVAWKMNVVRLPLNEASWLGYSCTSGDGSTRNADPGGNYRATVKQSVADANSAGLYVILDLHWSAPHRLCPEGQAPMADKDNSIPFWISVASTFKDNPAVMFELFNEPFAQNAYPVPMVDWQILRDGGTFPTFVHQNTSSGHLETTNVQWEAAGMQALLTAVRSTGATNVVLAGPMGWCADLSHWLAYKPLDPAAQLAVAWHAYPWGKDRSKPSWSGVGDQYQFAAAITAQLPLVITETGQSYSLAQALFGWADHNPSVSYLVWTWNPWGSWDLTTDASGNASEFGIYYRSHLACVADRAASCP